MTRILLVDDSPHAQRMGERILSDEGYEVVTVSNADSALIRLDDVDPDVVLADTVMPGRTGYDICQYLKMSPRHRHVRVILTAGVLEPIDPSQAARVQADGSVNKPFEASVLVDTIKPLAEAAARDRAAGAHTGAAVRLPSAAKAPPAAFVAVVDAEQVRAAVTVALDAAMGTMVEAITGRVLTALQTKKSEPPPLKTEESAPSADRLETEAAVPRIASVRRVNPLRRSASILGLEAAPPSPGDAPLGGPYARSWPPVAGHRPETTSPKPAAEPVPASRPEFAPFPETANRQPGPAAPVIPWAPVADAQGGTPAGTSGHEPTAPGPQ